MGKAISILIPTHNRSGVLARTLEAMCELDLKDLDAEFIIVANACTDDSEAVVQSFADRLPIRCLVQPKPGKNCALNRALAEDSLRPIVVFTDDDIDPARDWLTAIAETCERWPEHEVFGGRIRVVWPDVRMPPWANDPYIAEFGFALHDLSPTECLYDPQKIPFGPNYWLRRSVIEAGFRFNEAIGPHPSNRILGDEAVFLRSLRAAGYEVVYSPHAVVGHRIQPDVLTARGIRQRAFTLGRGIPHARGLPRRELLERRPWAWRLIRSAALLRDRLRVALTALWPTEDGRVMRGIHAMRDLGYQTECLRLARLERHPEKAPR